VQIGQDKTFVYVVKDGAAEMRTVKTGTTVESMTVIEEGLNPGEQVVTDGQLRIVPGAKVQLKGQGQGGRGGQGQSGGQGGPPSATNPNDGAQPGQGQGQGGGRRGGQNPNP
jgi:multidrug efflux system membrane fusion protein